MYEYFKGDRRFFFLWESSDIGECQIKKKKRGAYWLNRLKWRRENDIYKNDYGFFNP